MSKRNRNSNKQPSKKDTTAQAPQDATQASAPTEQNAAPQTQNAEPSVADIGKNNPGGKRGPSGPRTGAAMGAKPLVRKLMGTANEDGSYPAFTIDELCSATKKSDVNIRTILSDLRSPKYCGSGGVFMTHSFKKDGKTYYRYGDKPAEQQAQPASASTEPAKEEATAQ